MTIWVNLALNKKSPAPFSQHWKAKLSHEQHYPNHPYSKTFEKQRKHSIFFVLCVCGEWYNRYLRDNTHNNHLVIIAVELDVA